MPQMCLEFPGAEVVQRGDRVMVAFRMREDPISLLSTLRMLRDHIDAEVDKIEEQLTTYALCAASAQPREMTGAKPN
jgi:hypothetical protein